MWSHQGEGRETTRRIWLLIVLESTLRITSRMNIYGGKNESSESRKKETHQRQHRWMVKRLILEWFKFNVVQAKPFRHWLFTFKQTIQLVMIHSFPPTIRSNWIDSFFKDTKCCKQWKCLHRLCYRSWSFYGLIETIASRNGTYQWRGHGKSRGLWKRQELRQKFGIQRVYMSPSKKKEPSPG